jgi:hypothetical protein
MDVGAYFTSIINGGIDAAHLSDTPSIDINDGILY